MESLRIKLDYNNVMKEFTGDHGLAQEDFEGLSDKIDKAKKQIEGKRQKGMLEWMELPYSQRETAEEIIQYAGEKTEEIDAFIILGIGGSALGPMAVQQALNHAYYNEIPREKRGGFPRLYIADNIDPERLKGLFDIIEPSKCIFNVVSKSGSTSETMSQFMVIKEIIREAVGDEKLKDHIVCTTSGESGSLIKIAKEEGYKTFLIPEGVGGRFSQLSPVGLLPAAFCGIDIAALLQGAAYMDALCKNQNEFENPAYMYAIISYLVMEQKKNISVLMPYSDQLKYIADWYVQLWAESLGKKLDNDGNIVNAGPTPLKAVGVTDQHSQLQLFVEGPFDKLITFMTVKNHQKDLIIPEIYEDIPSLGFLGGKSYSSFINTQKVATEYALTKAGRINMTIELPEVSPFTIGQVLFFFEAAVSFMGELMNIDAFNQPGVEESKNASYAMFGRPGYEEKKKELDAKPPKKEEYII